MPQHDLKMLWKKLKYQWEWDVISSQMFQFPYHFVNRRLRQRNWIFPQAMHTFLISKSLCTQQSREKDASNTSVTRNRREELPCPWKYNCPVNRNRDFCIGGEGLAGMVLGELFLYSENEENSKVWNLEELCKMTDKLYNSHISLLLIP